MYKLSDTALAWLATTQTVTPGDQPEVDDAPPETLDGLSWFVVICRPRAEAVAQLGLRRAGYQTYLPVETKWRTHARKREAVRVALFPRYLFIGLRPGQDFYAMRGVDGAEGIVRIDTVPIQVRADRLVRILEAELSGAFDQTREPPKADIYRPGDSVLLKSGAFQDVIAIVQNVRNSKRLDVLISYLGRSTRLNISVADLEALR